MIKKLLSIIFLTLFTLLPQQSIASRVVQEVNYFSSLRSSETNVRSGPGQNYPIKFTYKIRSIPVKVISEYDNWNEIEDYEGQTGWVTQTLLTKRRTLIVRTTKSFVNLHSKNNEKSRIIFHLENNVIGDYLKCSNDWCGMKINNKKGWIKKSEIWGVDNSEPTAN